MDGDLRPSKESMREVRAEAKARKKAQKRRKPASAAEVFGWETPRRGRHASVWLAVVAAVCLLGSAGWFVLANADEGTSSTATPPIYPSGAPATATPSAAPTARPTPAGPVDPFAGSPVAAWLVGADAVVAPAAAPIGRFNASQVGDAYAKTRAYLIAANLDSTVVYGGKLDAVLAVLDPQEATRLRGVAAAPDDKTGNPLFYASRFFPGEVLPAVPGVRVNGSMAATQSTERSDELVVTFTYAFIYAVTPPTGGPAKLVLVRRDGTVYFYKDGHSKTLSRIWGGQSRYTNSDGVCGVAPPHPGFLDVFFVAPTGGGSPFAARDKYNPLDLKGPPIDGEGCYTDTSGL